MLLSPTKFHNYSRLQIASINGRYDFSAPESTAEDQEGLLEGEETPPPPYEQESSFSSAEGEVQTAVIA